MREQRHESFDKAATRTERFPSGKHHIPRTTLYDTLTGKGEPRPEVIRAVVMLYAKDEAQLAAWMDTWDSFDRAALDDDPEHKPTNTPPPVVPWWRRTRAVVSLLILLASAATAIVILTRTTSSCSSPESWPVKAGHIVVFETTIGYSGPDTRCPPVGHSSPGTKPVWCRTYGPEVRINGQYNHWWLWTKLNEDRQGWISAYYVKDQHNDEATDIDTGQGIPQCG